MGSERKPGQSKRLESRGAVNGQTTELVKSGVLKGGVGYVQVQGYIASCEVAEIRNAIIKFEQRSLYRIVLDLAKVNGMNILCLAHLVDQMWELRERGGDLRLVGVQPMLQNELITIGAEKLFTCYASREEARRWGTYR